MTLEPEIDCQVFRLCLLDARGTSLSPTPTVHSLSYYYHTTFITESWNERPVAAEQGGQGGASPPTFESWGAEPPKFKPT